MIAETHEALLSEIRGIMGDTCRFVEPHPGNWGDDAVRDIIVSAPSIYVAWLGARPTNRAGVINNEWAVFVVAETLNGRRDEPVGAYQMAERVMGLFAGSQRPGIGTMTFDRAKNLWSDINSGSGCAVYALYYLSPAAVDPLVPDENGNLGNLGDLLRHHQTFEQTDGAPVLEAHITFAGPKEDSQ